MSAAHHSPSSPRHRTSNPAQAKPRAGFIGRNDLDVEHRAVGRVHAELRSHDRSLPDVGSRPGLHQFDETRHLNTQPIIGSIMAGKIVPADGAVTSQLRTIVQ